MLSTLVGALAVHVIPNAFMKTVKSTKLGHKILTSTFDLGVQGKELSPMAKDLLTYVVGPESLIEYQLGLKVFNTFKNNGLTLSEAITSFRVELEADLKTFSEKEIKLAKETPFVSTLMMYAENAHQDVYTKVEAALVNTKSAKRGIKELLTYTGLASAALVVDPISIIQPAICTLRKKIGTSKFGKSVLKSNFKKGTEGNTFTKSYELTSDLLVAPSVLDTQRLGLFVNKYQFLKEIIDLYEN